MLRFDMVGLQDKHPNLPEFDSALVNAINKTSSQLTENAAVIRKHISKHPD